MSEVLVPAPAQGGARTSKPVIKVITSLLLPLFFVVVFPLMFVSALHKPAPHDLPLLVVGPTQVVAQIATGLEDTAEFTATHTDDVAAARAGVENRTVDGAVEITVAPPSDPAGDPTFTVTTYVANAAGRSAAGAVVGAGAGIATQLGTTPTVVDVAPLAATDELGITLFYLLAYTSLAAYLTIIVLTQVMPDAKLRVRFFASAIVAVVAPLIAFGLSSLWVGDYGASLGTIVAMLAVNTLYVFTVGAAAILVQQFLGNAATFGIMAFIVFLNFPSSGGPSPAAMLPTFWQSIHSFYFGAGAMESMRSIVYFGGHGAGRWILQLSLWTVGLILATVVVQLTKTTRRQQQQLAVLAAPLITSPAEVDGQRLTDPQAEVPAAVVDDDTTTTTVSDRAEREPLAAGEGALR